VKTFGPFLCLTDDPVVQWLGHLMQTGETIMADEPTTQSPLEENTAPKPRRRSKRLVANGFARPESQLPEPDYLTIQEAARRASLAPKTISNLIASGKLLYKHGLRRPGGNGRWRIYWPAFKKEWLDARGAF
jgi:hypothetical protein